ncbi:MAG TPA: hypothetical protein VFM01_01535 [Nakamurella sp.]|jgi:hypothetical protein|nr:hypothetical protein [Nakamurella sp.]
MTNPQPGPMPPPQQPGPYSQQPYPAYAGAPAGYGAAPARPGMVTGAAVLAFIVGGLNIIFDLIAFSVLSLVGGSYAIIIVLALVTAAALIFGGVQAITGKDGRILVIAAGAAIVINLIGMIIYFSAGSLLGLVIPVLILVFMMNAQSRNWFRAKGGNTF